MYKVLLVDDEKMIVNSLMLGFPWKEHGFHVVATASSGREALALIESLHPDVVLTDVKMPSMSGLELMEACRERAPGTVFIVISGHAEFAFAQKALSLGATAYCLKPLETDEIAAALAKAEKQLAHSDELRKAALSRFWDDPCADNAEALLAPLKLSGRVGIALSLGDADHLFAGSAPCVRFSLPGAYCIYLFPYNNEFLDSPYFRAKLLSSVTSGEIRAFIYDDTDAPEEYLVSRLPCLTNQLYAGFFSRDAAALGKAQTQPSHDSAFVTAFAALCNKNRLYEAVRVLRGISGQERAQLLMSDAAHLHDACEGMLARLENKRGDARPIKSYELAARYASFDDMLSSLYLRMERLLGAAQDPERLRNETLARVVRKVNATFTQSVSFQDICAEFAINPSYLSQLFKKELCVTFTGYVTRLRVSYAKELLETTATLVSEISDKVGFDSYLTFTRMFKRETGMTPSEYREKASASKSEQWKGAQA